MAAPAPSVRWVFNTAAHLPCYLVEWYGPELTARPLDETVAKLAAGAVAMRAEGSAVRLLMALTAHTDQVLYSLFAAASPDTVMRVCERAGFPAERLTAGIDARLMPDPHLVERFPSPDEAETSAVPETDESNREGLCSDDRSPVA